MWIFLPESFNFYMDRGKVVPRNNDIGPAATLESTNGMTISLDQFVRSFILKERLATLRYVIEDTE